MIKGTLEGEIISEGLLIVGPTAKVSAKVTTKNLVSHGEIVGDVTASEQVVLKETAVQTGKHHDPEHYRGKRIPFQRLHYHERERIRLYMSVVSAALREVCSYKNK